jgi:hypothetical protein
MTGNETAVPIAVHYPDNSFEILKKITEYLRRFSVSTEIHTGRLKVCLKRYHFEQSV